MFSRAGFGAGLGPEKSCDLYHPDTARSRAGLSRSVKWQSFCPREVMRELLRPKCPKSFRSLRFVWGRKSFFVRSKRFLLTRTAACCNLSQLQSVAGLQIGAMNMATIVHIFDSTPAHKPVNKDDGKPRDPASAYGAAFARDAVEVVMPHNAPNACGKCARAVSVDKSFEQIFRFPMMQEAR